MGTRYTWDNFTLYWSSKEATFNTPTNTTTNLATDVYYYFPMQIEGKARVRQTPRYYNSYTQGKTDWGNRGFEGNEVMTIDLRGPMWNFDMLYFLCKHCDTAGPSGSIYTHDTITTDGRLSSGVSFPILARLENDTADDHKLFTGCIIRKWDIEWEMGGLAILSMMVELGREWTGTALNSFPSKPNLQLYGPSEISTSWTKATVAYSGFIKRFKISWNDNAQLETYSGLYPNIISLGNRDIMLEIDFVPDTVTDHNDAVDRTNFYAHNRDIDFTANFVRTTNEDQTIFAFEKLCWIAPPVSDFSHNEYYEIRKYMMGLDPDESGYELTITQKDTHNNTRFEGA